MRTIAKMIPIRKRYGISATVLALMGESRAFYKNEPTMRARLSSSSCTMLAFPSL